MHRVEKKSLGFEEWLATYIFTPEFIPTESGRENVRALWKNWKNRKSSERIWEFIQKMKDSGYIPESCLNTIQERIRRRFPMAVPFSPLRLDGQLPR